VSSSRRIARLVEELGEVGLDLGGGSAWEAIVAEEIDYALRPKIHERRVPSYGALVEPSADPDRWSAETALEIDRRAVTDRSASAARPYADGITSWLLRSSDGLLEWVLFDRPAGSERDLVVLAEALACTVVQRHPSGVVRVVTTAGVFRWDGTRWQHQPLVSAWIDTVGACRVYGDREVLQTLLEFAVHDLGARGIGATLVYRADDRLDARLDRRLPLPPPLRIMHPADLAPLRHVLAQVDGAALFDEAGTLTQIGVRLVPSVDAESGVDGLRGTRHTSGRRYSFDDPTATVIVVSEDGPVTVLRSGEILGASAPIRPSDDGDAGAASDVAMIVPEAQARRDVLT
jgi:DNA integrity scanning protein DisA with diadenylate cyclase activity